MSLNSTNICPNCGAQTNKPICEYCGSVVNPPHKPKSHKNGDETVYVLPWPKGFQSDDTVIVKCLAHIRDMEDAPVDVFAYISDVRVQRYYLPMRQFNGNVTTDWNCLQIFDRRRIVDYEYKDGKKKPIYENYEECIPANGKGAADFNFVVCAASKIALPQKLVKCFGITLLRTEVTEKAQPLSSSLLVEEAVIVDEDPKVSDKNILKTAEEEIGKVAESASFRNLSGRLSDCNFTYRWHYRNAENKKLLIPATTVTFEYKGKRFTFAYIADGEYFNGERTIEYPKEPNSLIEDAKSQSKKYTKAGWLSFGLSFVLTVSILLLWGDLTPKVARLTSIFGAIVILIAVAWKALSVSAKYDELAKHSKALSTIRRTESLKKAFPQYANSSQVNKVTTDESDTHSEIGKVNSSIRKQRIYIKLLIIVQMLLVAVGLYNMNRIAENRRAAYRVQQERILEQERQEQQRQAEEKRIAQEKFEEEQRQLEPAKKWILSQLAGKTYAGECWMNKDGIRIYFLNENTLQFSTTTKFQHDRSNWSEPISISYSIDIKKESLGVSSWYRIVIRSREFYSDEINIHDDKFNPYDLRIKYKDENYTLYRKY